MPTCCKRQTTFTRPTASARHWQAQHVLRKEFPTGLGPAAQRMTDDVVSVVKELRARHAAYMSLVASAPDVFHGKQFHDHLPTLENIFDAERCHFALLSEHHRLMKHFTEASASISSSIKTFLEDACPQWPPVKESLLTDKLMAKTLCEKLQNNIDDLEKLHQIILWNPMIIPESESLLLG